MNDKAVQIIVPVITILLYMYNSEIKDLIKNVLTVAYDLFTYTMYIKKIGNEKIVHSIIKELESVYETSTKKMHVRQANNSINYSLCSGTYYIWYEQWIIFIKLEDNDVILWTHFKNKNILQNFIRKLYTPDNESKDFTCFYMQKDDCWNTPLIRRTKPNIFVSDSMKLMIDNVAKFFTKETLYETSGKSFRRGYFIQGANGVGKSSIIEIIASIHKMCVYMVNLNSMGMTDTVLINLVGSVPPFSLIVFDEFDKQYEAIQKNKNVQVSDAGVLSAIDGSQRLSHGSVVVVIVNEKDCLSEKFYKSLTRKGRLDKSYVFV